MATQGPNSAGLGANVAFGIGNINWTNPTYIYTSNSGYAYCVLTAGKWSNFLTATNFGFTIPANSVIDGITVQIECVATEATGAMMYLTKNGTDYLPGSGKAFTFPATKQYVTVGGAVELWGQSFTLDEINASTFGVMVLCNPDMTYYIDHIRITINYTVATTKTLSDLETTFTETISKESTSYPYLSANNNQAYLLDLRTKAWTFIDNYPFSNVIYRPQLQTIIGARRDTGNLATLDSGTTFDGTTITWTLRTGFYDFGALDEMKKMPDDASQAIKRLRALYAEVRTTGNITLTIFTESDSTGKSFTITPATTDGVVYNMVRTTLSRDIKGKYISFQFSASVPAWIGETSVKIMPRAIR